MHRRFLITTVAAVAVIAASCSTSTTSSDGNISEPFTKVVVNAIGGSVQIERTTGTPEWLAEVSYSEALPDFEPKVEEGVLIVDDGCSGYEGDCAVDYLIQVPEGTEVEATTVSADVTITNISAAVTVSSTSGVIFLNTVKGDISVDTVSGDILGTKLEAATAAFDSTSGDIDVAFERIITNLTVDTTSGNITAQLAGDSYNLEVDAGGARDLKIDDDETSTNLVTLTTETGDLTVYKQ